MDYLFDVLLAASGLGVGFWAGRFWRSLPVLPSGYVHTPQPTPGRRDDNSYSRFHYADGRVEVRKFLNADLLARVGWKDKIFLKGQYTPDGWVYKEEVIGRQRNTK